MLKTCVLPTLFHNYSNKTCGEIVCQTETIFFIICKLCDIKIFTYDEFKDHFRSTHRPEIFDHNAVGGRQTRNGFNNIDKSECKDEISTVGKSAQNNNSNAHIRPALNVVHENCPETDLEESISGIKNTKVESELEDLSIFKKVSNKTFKAEEKRFKCDECGRKFTTKFYLRFHISQQHEPKNFHCDKCNKYFVKKRYLTLHQRSHVGYTCQVCHKVFDKYEALRYHAESHIQTRNFLCDYESCRKAFPNNRRLSAHKRSHFAQPSFVCEICGSLQRSKEFLVVHIRTHTGEKPYACQQCDRCFASKQFLQDHQSVHATERCHVCTICSKAFASSKSLYHHRHLHSNVKKYVCKICSSAYSQAAGLSGHMRKHKEDYGLLDPRQIIVASTNFS